MHSIFIEFRDLCSFYYTNKFPFSALSQVREKSLGFIPLLEIAQDLPTEGESYGDIKIRPRPRGPNDDIPET